MPKSTWKLALVVVAAGFMGLVVLCAGVFGPCWTSWIGDAVYLDRCPAGNIRPVVLVDAYGLGRKDIGSVEVGVTGHYVDTWGSFQETPVRRFTPTLTLVSPDGVESVLMTEDGWDDTYAGRQSAAVKLPEGPDGDYVLRVSVASPAGDASVDAPLPLYQPALAHVLTDAPLYKPGQDVKFRAVLLGAADLAPLEGRPGVWKVWSPEGDLLLEEKAKTGAFGVVSGSFPLDAAAASGDWSIAFESGPATDKVTVAVRPFQLPRFTVDAKSPHPYWRISESPVVEGSVRYTSGAPVAKASVQVAVRSAPGEWPAPRAWLESRTITTDASGAFRVELDPVPADLRGRATLTFAFTATDETGDQETGRVPVLLSEDPLAAEAVTELAGGMVPAANNRMYLRVTTPDGRTLPGSTVRIRKEWDAGDPGLEAKADADGVARFQLDPGEPVTVVVPALPVRPQPRAAVVAATLSSATDVLSDESLDLAGQAALDRWTASVRGCADRVTPGGTDDVNVSALVGADGRVRQTYAASNDGQTPVARCVRARVAGLSGPVGRDRLWSITWHLSDPETPWVESDVSATVGADDGVTDAIDTRLADARGCVAGIDEALAFPHAFAWQVAPGTDRVVLTAMTDPSVDGRVPAAAAGCVERALDGLRLAEVSEDGGAGLVRLSAAVASADVEQAPQPTTFPGFAFRVEASTDGQALGSTILRMAVGAVPNLRLRFSDVLADPGSTVEIAAIRGPDFVGSFPKKMTLMQGDRTLTEFDFDPDKRKGSVTIPADVDGFVHVQYLDAKAVLYVRPKRSLALSLATDARSYRPGETAKLTVTAKDGSGPVAAGVTLSGVDSTLATLATLPAPDAFARITVRATSDIPAFGVLDAQALQTGQIAGENAAQAAVLRVTGLPTLPPGADRVNVSRVGAFTPDAELADAFYELYRSARAEVRVWEGAAPAGELLTATKMVELWEKALAAHPAADPYGRPLHLTKLPPDLLALTDPRFMASDGARLPEDVENWPLYVSTEAE
jgi:hypothetical protein